jgi:hypothetical protein
MGAVEFCFVVWRWSLSRGRYMFTIANAREITEREVEEALIALYAAYGAEPVF